MCVCVCPRSESIENKMEISASEKNTVLTLVASQVLSN